MSGLEVIIEADGFTVSYGRGKTVQEFRGEGLDGGECLHGFTDRHGITSTSVNLFVSEELIFATSISLPVRTPDIAEAVKFQLGLITPFREDEVLYSYSAQRAGELYKTTIFAARAGLLANSIEEIIAAGFQVRGLYPESQRYVTNKLGKEKWALVMPGKFTKVFVFSGTVLEDRMLCHPDLSFAKTAELCGTESLYHTARPAASRFQPSSDLLSASPVLKDFNMLPASYRRPDYTRMAIIALLAVNLFALIFVTGYKLRQIDGVISETEAEIARLAPVMMEVSELRREIKKNKDFLAGVQGLEANTDLISFLTRLTEELPETSYLDQLQLNGKEKVVVIQGYTDNVGELTEKLQVLGETRLKSTSRRKNRTYFQVEIGLP
ncbi:MAG: hypothetical protein KKG47_14860 [Proteobacteria bacterium]|nr:hypothetical protein [Pseudomonadota bacterium]MBU1737285.1 hypothetical protein [Pseudomonadota bacterium]